jgi:hypothetical protein
MELATFIATAVGVLSTAAIGLIAFLLSRHAQQYTVQRAIGDLKTAMARYGAEFPEVMRTAPRWNEQANARLYGRGREADDDIIVRYRSYVELGLESATPRWRRPRPRGSRPTS